MSSESTVRDRIKVYAAIYGRRIAKYGIAAIAGAVAYAFLFTAGASC